MKHPVCRKAEDPALRDQEASQGIFRSALRLLLAQERLRFLQAGLATGIWSYGEGIEVGVEMLERSGEGAAEERNELEASGGLKSAVPVTARAKNTRRLKKGFSKERVEAVLKAGGKLSRAELLRCQVRWFSDGVAIGSKGFVEGIFTRCREHFGPKRKTGARPVREDAGGLHALRELRRRAVT